MTKNASNDPSLTGTLAASQWRVMLDVAIKNAAIHNNVANGMAGAGQRSAQRTQRAQARKWEAIVALIQEILKPSSPGDVTSMTGKDCSGVLSSGLPSSFGDFT